MVTRTDCPCGKTDLSSAQMTMHRRSKAHKDWAAENGEVEDVAPLVTAISRASWQPPDRART